VKSDLWKQSGHWDFYEQGMFKLEVEDEDYAFKPMNCPESTLVFGFKTRSYRDLPLRVAEPGGFVRVFVDAGPELAGLIRQAAPGADMPLQLALGDTRTDGYRSAYVTTELWAHFAEVWVQPAYVPVTGWNADGTPVRLLGPDGHWHPIFSVGPHSAFYSPFWQIVYVGGRPVRHVRSPGSSLPNCRAVPYE